MTQQQQSDDLPVVPSDLLCKRDNMVQDIIRMQATVRTQRTTIIFKTYFQYNYQWHAYSTGSSDANTLENDTATPADVTLTVMQSVTWCESDNQHRVAIQCCSMNLDVDNNQHTCAITMYNAATESS